jgi:hypothetical protein
MEGTIYVISEKVKMVHSVVNRGGERSWRRNISQMEGEEGRVLEKEVKEREEEAVKREAKTESGMN